MPERAAVTSELLRLAERGGLCPRALAARRFAAYSEQRRAAFRAAAFPAGPTVWQGHLARVGDDDLLAADAPALWAGVLYLVGVRLDHVRQAYLVAYVPLTGALTICLRRTTSSRSMQTRSASPCASPGRVAGRGAVGPFRTPAGQDQQFLSRARALRALRPRSVVSARAERISAPCAARRRGERVGARDRSGVRSARSPRRATRAPLQCRLSVWSGPAPR